MTRRFWKLISGPCRHRALLSLAVIVAWFTGNAGCISRQLTVSPVGLAPIYQQIANAQNQRLEKLKTIYADGVIEIRWRDKDGKNHFEQGDMELWLQLPRHTALRVQKLGEVLLWLGSNDERYWLFDMVNSKEKVLHTAAHDQSPQLDENDDSPLGVRPLVLLDLMGLAALPVIDHDPPPVVFDKKLSAWVIKINAGEGRGPMRMYFDGGPAFKPVRIETLDAQDKVVLTSSLQRYDSVQLQGMSPAAFPKMPKLIEISGTTGGESGQVKIVINEASGIYEEETLSRVFDLDRLIKGIRPDRIEGELPQLKPPVTKPNTTEKAPGRAP